MVSGGHASGTTVKGVIITFTVLTGLLTALRLFTRRVLVENAGIDDLLIAIGLVLSTLVTITMYQQVVYGVGQHEEALTAHDGEMSLRWFWASVWMYYSALWAVKMSILCQYLRILPEGGYRKAAYVLMGIITAWTVWAVLSAVFACTPIHAFWDTSVEGTCLNRLAVWFSNAAVNILTDIATTILPIPALKTLRMPAKQKSVLLGIFSLGGVVCVISVLRLQSLYVISKSTDISWDNPMAATYSSLEVNVGIICSCIPTLKGLVSRLFPSLRFGESYNRTLESVDTPVSSETKDVTNYTVHELPADEIEKGHLQPKIEEIHELPTYSCSSRGSRLFSALNIRDSRIMSYCPGLTEEQLAREKISKFVSFKRFENTRKHGLLFMPEAAVLSRPTTAPKPEISPEEKARAQVRDFVERRPSSRKGPARRSSSEARGRSKSESSGETSLGEVRKQDVEG